MKKYKVEFTKSALKEYKKIPKKTKEKILEVLSFLSQNPYSEFLKIKQLKGEPNLYRIRFGDYRLVYEVKKRRLIVLVIKIGHRKEVYKKN